MITESEPWPQRGNDKSLDLVETVTVGEVSSMAGRAYVAFGGINMYAATGRDNYYVGNHLQGFLNNARWHKNAPWRSTRPRDIADSTTIECQQIGAICSTVLNSSSNWQEKAKRAIRSSSCMIALLAGDPRRPVDSEYFSPWVRWEIAVAADTGIPVYVMRRTDANWMTDLEVKQFVQQAAGNSRGRELKAKYYGKRIEGWDESKWAYPGLSQFLDAFYSRP